MYAFTNESSEGENETVKCVIKKGLVFLLVIIVLFPWPYEKEKQVKAEGSQTDSIEFQHVSVHDPSIIKGNNGSYYVFGSHIAAAKSTDLMNWTSLVTSEYQAPENNPIYGNLSENLAESFKWAGENDADSTGGYSV